MPLIIQSDYRPLFPFRNGHVNTVYAALCRSAPGVGYRRERWDTPDGDFLDMDWAAEGQSNKLLLALHGMEGSSDRQYIKGLLKLFAQHGWDGLAMNFRGCSGVPNRLARAYHMGETGDLHFVLEKVRSLGRYQEIALAGFSLGGNVIVKYLGEQGDALAPEIQKAVVFSVPCDILTAEKAIAKPINRPYVLRFLSTLNPKMLAKAARFPNLIDASPPLPRSLREFDNRFTAPLHGFQDAEDYWTRSSSLPCIERITIPLLMINALDDSFLSPQCYPRELAGKMPNFFLETPRYGGHVGFVTFGARSEYWSERRALEFVLKGR